MPGWLGGIQVHRLERGQVPVADLLCARCWHHRRVTGADMVRDFLASHPITTHRDQCPANTNGPS